MTFTITTTRETYANLTRLEVLALLPSLRELDPTATVRRDG